MRVFRQVAGFLAVACLASPGWAQDPAPTPPRAVQKPAPKPASKPAQKAAQLIVVRNVSGGAIEGVQVTISGAGRAEATTNAEGSASVSLAAGSYRFRFEHDDFLTLERDVTVKNPQASEIAVALTRAPRAPEPPPPAPAPAPPPPPAAPGPPVNISIPEFLEKTFVGGREPMKESVLSCMTDATARLLQLRDPVAAHTHSDVDEVLYVVAGEGAVRIGQDVVAVRPGSMTAIPRGTQHGIERRGRNPLIVLSMQAGAGAPCALSTAKPDSR